MNSPLHIRPGVAADIPRLSKAYAESWRSTYQGMTPEVLVKGITA